MEQNLQFKWGEKAGDRNNRGSQFYLSFTMEGVEYLLYDSVYLYPLTGSLETYIGKLVSIFETETHEKKVRVLWFFRPAEICNFLGDYEPHWNELFLGSGEGKGLSNINPLEAIAGKCNVVCTSKDDRNRQPSKEELRTANYFFCCTFDVGKCEILENFPDEIRGLTVERYFNKRNNEKLLRIPKFQTNLKDPAGRSMVSSKLGSAKLMPSPVKIDKSSSRINPVVRESEVPTVRSGARAYASNETLRLQPGFDGFATQSARISHNQEKEKRKTIFLDQPPRPPMAASDTRPSKKMRVPVGVDSTKGQNSEKKADVDRTRWFKQLPWEERLQIAQDAGQLVLLDNLEPSYSSSEVEGLVWQAFGEKVEAKMLQYSIHPTPNYGKAFVIFKSSVAAESAINKLKEGCLVADKRPIIGIRRTLKVPDKAARFVGHLSIPKLRFHSQREEMRRAISTSHCSQPNTIEYDMAMEWCLLQQKSDLWWDALYKEKIVFLLWITVESDKGCPVNWTAYRVLPT